MDSSSILYTQPDWNIPDDQKTPEWWKQNIRYFSTYYNRPHQVWNKDNYMENLSPVEKGFMYSLYYIGKQRNILYNHITVDPSGNTMQAVWTKTKKVKNLLDRLAGNYVEQLAAKEISAKTLSKRAVSKKMKEWEETMFQYDEKGKLFLQEMAKNGIEYNPPYAGKFTSQEEADKYFNYDWKDDLEEVSALLGKYIDTFNDYDTTLVQSFLNDFCPANIMATYNYVEHGRVCQKRIPFYSLITDPVCDDPFMKDARFAGMIERYSPQQVSYKWGKVLTPTEMDEIKTIAQGGVYANEFLGTYNTGTVGWWMNGRDNYMISAVTIFWIGPRDTRYALETDRYGNKKMVKSKDQASSGEVINDIHYATLLGNKYLVESGYMKNVIRQHGNKAKPRLPIICYNGNTTLGDGVSITGMIAELINKMDRCEYKIEELTGKNIGKAYVFNGAKFPTGVDMKKMSTELKTMGVTVSEPTGEPNDKVDNQPLVSPMDFSLDEAIIEYSNLSIKYENTAEQLLNLPKAAQGFDNQSGLGVQRGAIQQSAQGNINLYNNLFKFNKLNLAYSVDLARLIYANGEGDETAEFVVGTRGLEILKIIKDYLFEDVMVEVSPRDAITDTQRARINDIALALAQNGGRIDIRDALDIEMADTLTEARNMLDYSLNKKDQQMAQSEHAAAQQNADMVKLKNDILTVLEQMRQEGLNQREQLRAQTVIMKEDLKLNGKEEPAAV